MSPRTARGAVREAVDADDPVARRSAFLHRGFVRYLGWTARRHFHGLRVLPPLPDVPANRPVIVYSNHPGWWDPAIFFLLGARLFPDRIGFGPMEANALERYGILRRLGIFGLDAGPRGAARFLRTASHVLAAPERMLWITAEGAFTDARVRPVALLPGVAHLARRTPGAVLLPLALEYTFWNESRPEALAAFGAPQDASDRCDTRTWEERLAATLEATMDRLSAAAMTRAPHNFVALLDGRAGEGGLYDIGRRLAAWSRLRRFDPRHEP